MLTFHCYKIYSVVTNDNIHSDLDTFGKLWNCRPQHGWLDYLQFLNADGNRNALVAISGT